MQIAIGLEKHNEDGQSTAWALDYPGCFASGKDAAEAIVAIAPAMIKYQNWAAEHTSTSWLAGLGDFDVRLAEVFDVYHVDRNYELATPGEGTYEVGAFFRSEWRPLAALEVENAAQMLRWSRADLLAAVNGLTDAELDQTFPGERWSIRGILGHVAGAEWWYLERLNLTGLARADLPADKLKRLEVTRADFEKIMPELVGLERVMGRDGELWSPRKLIRRALWHELDHIGHIYKLLISFFPG